jgi:hypothetical protein
MKTNDAWGPDQDFVGANKAILNMVTLSRDINAVTWQPRNVSLDFRVWIDK